MEKMPVPDSPKGENPQPEANGQKPPTTDYPVRQRHQIGAPERQPETVKKAP